MLYDEHGAVRGVATGDMGVGKDGEPTANFQPGMELIGKYTLFAEGARGHLGKQVIARFKLDEGRDPQTYGIGIKELWEVDPAKHVPGLVLHSAGWPLDNATYGGGFLYHFEDNQVSVGLVVGLGYTNPYLEPFQEFQRYKTHPAIRAVPRRRQAHRLRRARDHRGRPAIAAEARRFPAARWSAAMPASSTRRASRARTRRSSPGCWPRKRRSTRWRPAARATSSPPIRRRSRRPGCTTSSTARATSSRGSTAGSSSGALMCGIDQLVFRGKAPWTLHRREADHEKLKPAAECTPIDYPKPDGVLTFDQLSSVFLSNTNHEENQPSHLTLKDAAVPVAVNLARYAGPEARYCPAGVYEFVKTDDGAERLQINAQNCVHCKTCDIKDPTQNIVWVAPEGGGGPKYPNM